ncbi:MAG: hypothetical protein ABSG15_10825 [FCB group bacterium]
MKLGSKSYIISIIILLFITGCSTKYTKILPPGNLNKFVAKKDSINTIKDEVAPVQLPIGNYSSPFGREFEYPAGKQNVFSSQMLLRKDFFNEVDDQTLDYLTDNVESMSFLGKKSCFISLSHVPDNTYSTREGLPVIGITGDPIGGTDILEYNVNNDWKFHVLDSNVNSIFWDSHPFAIDTTIRDTVYTLLLWTSDRETPFQTRINLSGTKNYHRGNTSLYYSFRKTRKNENSSNWQPAQKFKENINLPNSSAGTPFIYCFCYNPNLFFSSNRNNSDSSDFDIYSVKIKIDFDNLIIEPDGTPELLKKFPKSMQFVYRDSAINSTADERFPFVASPISDPNERYIYFSSDRNSGLTDEQSKVSSESDTIIKNSGGYDLYRFPLPQNVSYKCEPPPPPKLFLLVHIHRTMVNAIGDTIGCDTNVGGATYNLNSETQISNTKYEILTNTKYFISPILPSENCYDGNCASMELFTPRTIIKDSTIEVTLDCIERRKPEEFKTFSFTQGIAFFITGYWWPTTTNNLKEFKSRMSNKKLETSRFIDAEDYKSGNGDFYQDAAQKNDAFFDELYVRIDSLLSLLDACYNNQKLIITTHGYTDPCPLRIVKDDKGNVIQDYTVYSCDGPIEFNDVVIPQNVKMKYPNLMLKSGKPFKPPYGVQQGNYVLAMLRAYYTKETIVNGFKNKFKDQPADIAKFDNFISFKYNAFGIYDDRPPCPNIVKKIVGVEQMNKRYPPDNIEPCNLPHSRRVMIYLDLVKTDDVDKFSIDECGGRQKEKLPEPVMEEPLVIKDTVKLDLTKEKADTLQKPDEGACAGPDCFRVLFGTAENADDYSLLKGVIESLGFGILPPLNENDLDLKSQRTFSRADDARKYIEEFKAKIKKLDGIVKIKVSEIKAKVKPVQ